MSSNPNFAYASNSSGSASTSSSVPPIHPRTPFHHHHHHGQSPSPLAPRGLEVVSVQPDRQPKNRRKRTQESDKYILEEAYAQNPKPDKRQRDDIVKRVTMSAKQVQIWFQNRRQNDRRKSRPLDLTEWRYGLQPGPYPYQSPMSRTYYPSGASPQPHHMLPTPSHTPQTPQHGHHHSAYPHTNSPYLHHTYHHPHHPPTTPYSMDRRMYDRDRHDHRHLNYAHDQPSVYREPFFTPHTGPDSRHVPSHEQHHQQSWGIQRSSTPFTPSPALLAEGYDRQHQHTTSDGDQYNRYHTSTPTSATSSQTDTVNHAAPSSSATANTVSSSSGSSVFPSAMVATPASCNKLRLSFSLEGKAKVVETSPPRKAPAPAMLDEPDRGFLQRNRGLLRSQSDMSNYNTPSSGIRLPSIASFTQSLPPLGPHVSNSNPSITRYSPRSRDVEEWERCADELAPDHLTKLADSEAQGSADAAITILRSTHQHGHHNVLQPNHLKRNAPVGKSIMDGEPSTKKSRLYRSVSNMARIQSPPVTIRRLAPEESGDVLKSKEGEDDGEEEGAAAAAGVLGALKSIGTGSSSRSNKLAVGNLLRGQYDDDKENWGPGRYQQPQQQQQRSVGHLSPMFSAINASRSVSSTSSGGQNNRSSSPLLRSFPSGLNNTPRKRRAAAFASQVAIYDDSRSSVPARDPSSSPSSFIHSSSSKRTDTGTDASSERNAPLKQSPNLPSLQRILAEPRTPQKKSGKRATSAVYGKDGDKETKPRGEMDGEGDVERFMRGEVSPSKKGDVDCVAGLLALSQGNWR